MCSDPVLRCPSVLGVWGGDAVHGIAVDLQGNAYIAGGTFSLDFPVTSNGFQETCGTQQFPCNDVFIAKLSADGTTLLYATYLGGFRTDEAHGIAVDLSGNAYVTGRDRHFE